MVLPQLAGVLSSAITTLGPSWLDPQHLVADFGGWAVLGVSLVVFAETGLLLGFFLPGDTLLFTAGLLTTTGAIGTPLWQVVLAVVAAAFVGGQSGFSIGRSAGRAVLERSRLVQDDQLERAERFFTRHGRSTLVAARFVPVVRTLVPVIAGAARMPQRTYAVGNAVGAALWAAGLTLVGAWLGNIPAVREFVLGQLDYVILGVVGLSLLLTLVQVVRHRRSAVRGRRQADLHPPQPPVPAGHGEGPL